MIITIKRGTFSTKAKILKYPLGIIKGLMFSKKLKPNNSVLLKLNKEKIQPIHMLFVFFPIDAVWINSKNKIVHIERNIKPFTLKITPKKPAIAILETQKNTTKNLKTGNTVELSKPL